MNYTGGLVQTKNSQITDFHLMVPLAVLRNLTVVIHVRVEGNGSALTDCLEVLNDKLPATHQIWKKWRPGGTLFPIRFSEVAALQAGLRNGCSLPTSVQIPGQDATFQSWDDC